jgi:hypothetical protein
VPTAPSVSTKQEAVTVPRLTPEQEIERIGNTWAPLFAAGPLPRACRYETQPLCERIACQRVGGFELRDCTQPTSAFRNSFFGATVQDVEIRGHRAAARFSNGEMVELFGDGGTWSIHRLGGNAGRRFFELRDARPDASPCAGLYSTVTVLARFRGWSTFIPRSLAMR